MLEVHCGDFTISDEAARIDTEAVYVYLSRSYWASGTPLSVIARSLQHSLCLGLYRGDEQIGLVRIVTDYATFAYLCDVYVLEPYCGKGLGKWLLSVAIAHPALQGLRRWCLVTRDAQNLYRQYGFREVEMPHRWMERCSP